MANGELIIYSDGSEKVLYNDLSFPIFAREVHLADYPASNVSWHWHDDFEFSYVLEGEMVYCIDSQTVKVSAGQGVFINSGHMHSNFEPHMKDCRYYGIVMHPSVIADGRSEIDHCVNAVMRNDNYPFAVLTDSDIKDQPILKCIEQLCRLVTGQGSYVQLGILSYSAELLSLIAQRMPEASAPPVNQQRESVAAMVKYIQRNFADNISLADLADAGHVSINTCITLFKRSFALTPANYLRNYRLDKAASLLRMGETSITQIAIKAGFSGSSYFTECFRKRFGITPTQYRQGLSPDASKMP